MKRYSFTFDLVSAFLYAVIAFGAALSANAGVYKASLQSVDSIVGERQVNAVAADYYTSANSTVGVGGSGGSSEQTDRNVVLGYTLPPLAEGSSVTGAVFKFEITANRDTDASDPALDVYLLDTANPDSSGTNFFYHGPSAGAPASGKFVGETYIDVGSTQITYADDQYDIEYTLTGDALTLLQSFYGGDHQPDQTEVFFRFSMDKNPAFVSYTRYIIDLASNESALDVYASVPAGATVVTTNYSANDVFVVPPGVSAVTVKAWGAGGGGGAGGQSGNGGAGGSGGFAQGTFSVSLGDSLSITIGGGASGGTVSALANPVGEGGGGGGLSSVSNSTASSLLLVAAGGGGGGGGDNGSNNGGAGGAGGGLSGVDGSAGAGSLATGGTNGTQSAGGGGGVSDGGDSNGDDGSAFNGGAGGDGKSGGSGSTGGASNGGAEGGASGGTYLVNGYPGGGGGGAGYFGGGGGCGATYYSNPAALSGSGGGGGSSFAEASGAGITMTAGSGTTPANTGDSSYIAGIAEGGAGGAGGGSGAAGTAGTNGLVVITYEQVAVGSIVWFLADTTNTTLTSAWATVTVNTNLTEGVLVWDTSDHVPGTTNDWPSANRIDLGARDAGVVTEQIINLATNTAYTWRIYGVKGSTNAWTDPVSFTTLGAPIVEPAGAEIVSRGEVAVKGLVSSIGVGSLTDVIVYLGTSDGVETPSSWDTNFVFDAGAITEGVSFPTNLPTFSYDVQYFYRVYAANSDGYTTWSAVDSFTVPAPPELDSLSPINTATGVDPDATLTATFTKNVLLIDGGTITITNLTDGTASTITIPDTSKATASGASVIITPAATLNLGDTYAVLFSTNAVEDAVVDSLEQPFAGVSDTNTWQFTVTDDKNWSLVAYWPLNDGTDGQTVTVADDVIDHATYPAVDAVPNNALATWVDDAERGIVLNSPESNSLNAGQQKMDGDFTWSVWVKTSDAGGHIIGTRSGNPWNSVQPAQFVNWASCSYVSIGNGNWHHLAIRRSGTTVYAYQDGVQVDTATKSGTYLNNFRIGGDYHHWSEGIDAMISDVAVWSEALSPTRIANLANGGDVILSFSPPVIVGLTPTNNATGVAVGDNLIVTFDDVIATNAGSIVISNLTELTGIAITVPGTDPDGIVTLSGSNLTINPTANLDALDTYAVLIDGGVIENENGYDFAGISDTNTWRFTAGSPDTDPPLVSSLQPVNGGSGWPVASNLVATFNENVSLVNGGVITITNLTDNTGSDITVPNAQISVLNTELTIDPSSDLDFGDLYAIQIDADAIDDSSGNSFAGILDTTTWRFTADTRPAVVTLVPADDSSGATTSTNLMMTFDKAVQPLVGGVIRVRNLTDSTEKVLTIQDDDGITPGVQDDRLTIVGSTVTINPRSNLEYGDDYAIRIDASAFEDVYGQGFSGISDDTTWNFSTDPDPNANLTAYWPLTDGTNGQTVASTGGADDWIDDPLHSARDATESGTGNTWAYDADMGRIVLRTVAGGRLDAGNTQMNMDFTWSCWAKGIGGSAGVVMGTRSGSYTRLYLTGFSGSYFNLDFADFNDNAWHHMAFTRKDNLFKVYIDGNEEASKTQAAGDNNMKLEFGGTVSFPSDFNGYMSDVAIWLEALTETRIQKLAAGTPVIPAAATIFLFR